MSSRVPLIRTRLSVMMFLELFLWASWYSPISTYMTEVLKFNGTQVGWIYATTTLGAIISPMFVGFIADRLFATERVLAVLHLLGGACLLLASRETTFPGLMTLLMINAICFMPTLALANSLSFRNIDNPDRFSRIAVWGTIGWIISGQLVDQVLGGATHKEFFYLAGGGAIALGLYCLTLPHTPPGGTKTTLADVLGLSAAKLLVKSRSLLSLAICAFLISIPLAFYFVWANLFVKQLGYENSTSLLTLSQCSEIVVMLIMPWMIGRIGLKNVLVIGMGAWAVRYLLFATTSFPLVVLSLLIHGFCYCCVFVASFIYISKATPAEMTARAQSLMALLMWGLGMFVGTALAGWTGKFYAGPQGHHWAPIWLWPAALAAVVCVIFWIGGREVEAVEKQPEFKA